MSVVMKLGVGKLRKLQDGKRVMVSNQDVVEMPQVKPKGPKRELNAGLRAYLEKKKAMKTGMPTQEGDGFGSFLGAIARPLAGVAIREGGKALSDVVAKKVEGGAIKKGRGKKAMKGGTFKLKM